MVSHSSLLHNFGKIIWFHLHREYKHYRPTNFNQCSLLLWTNLILLVHSRWRLVWDGVTPCWACSEQLVTRGCARGGHGVIGAHFAKIDPNFGFLVAIEGHSWPLLFELWGISEQVMTLKVCVLTPNFFYLRLLQGSSMTPDFKT